MRRVSELCLLAVDCVNKTAPRLDYETPYKMIRTTNIKSGFVYMDDVGYVSEETFEKWTRRSKPQYGDVILTREAPVGEIGRFTYNDDNVFLGQRLFQYRADPELLDWNFLAYALQSHEVQGRLRNMGFGATVEHIKVGDAENLLIPCPPIDIQRRIGSTLAAYDDLIENNRRRMALLEDSARQLYREWFVRLRFPGHEHTPIVEGVPQGWEKLPATEALEINPKIKLSDAEEHWFVEMANLPTDSMVIEGAYLREGRSGPKFQNGDTLFARITPCLENGKTGFVDFMDEGVAGRGSTEFIVLRSKRVTPEFVYCLSRTYEFRGNAIKSMIGSSGRQRVQESCFEKFMVNVPPTSLLRLFSGFAEPAFEEIKNLALQNQKLRQARDLLLPRLMNGELAV
jgi:type I restriction enzyme S subunit